MRFPARVFLAFAGVVVVVVGEKHVSYADNLEAPSATKSIDSPDVLRKVTAIGTIEPANTIEVYPRVSDRIIGLGGDPHVKGKTIESGSLVEKNTVLAQIDPTLFVIRVEQAQAECKLREAELAQTQAKLELAESQCQRSEDRQSHGLSSVDPLTAKPTREAAKAVVTAAEAAVAKSKASLKEAERNLSDTTIKSPMKGVVIARRVNVGQMAFVGPNIPALFLLADITKLHIWASVNEVDIGRIHEKQAVRFTVAACPGKVFEGEVKQIRLDATMMQNAVTYTVVVAVSDTPEKLFPYMTAHLEFQ